MAHLTTVHRRRDVRIFHKECVSLATAGLEVHLLVADGRGEEHVSGVQVHDVGTAAGRLERMARLPLRMWRLARRLKARVYHFHDPELIPVGLLLRLGGAQVVYDSHEDVPRAILSKSWIRPWLRRTVAALFERFEDFAASRFAAVVAATPHIARRFARVNARSRDISNYPLAAEMVEIGPFAPEAEGGRCVCYLGGIGLIRGAVEMVQALEHVDATMLLAGPFESPETEAVLRRLPGWGRVDYLGVLPRTELPKVMRRARIGLLLFHPEPNHVDAQPNKMFEYMAAGMPILASDFPLWRAMLAETDAGRVCDPLDPRAIAAAIGALLDDPEGARRMGSNGRVAVATRFQWSHEERRLTDLYRELLA